jgi:hypothetical protein
MGAAQLKAVLPRELLASVVVFLVALPLCMGIAIASGYASGQRSDHRDHRRSGGRLAGGFAVAGQWAGGGPGGAGLRAGARARHRPCSGRSCCWRVFCRCSPVALKLGCWFRVTAPAVVYGMLAGIGVLIVLSQAHVMLDARQSRRGWITWWLSRRRGFRRRRWQRNVWQAGLLGLANHCGSCGCWDKLRRT